MNIAFKSESIPKELQESLIVLIPKTFKETQTLQNLRPISLLNYDYKMLMKCIKKKLTPILTKIVGNHQSCAVPGRCIINNTCGMLSQVLTRDAIADIYITKKPSILISLDFDHAFDRVDHKFITSVLEKIKLKPEIKSFIKKILK